MSTTTYSFLNNNVGFYSPQTGASFSLSNQGSAEGGITVEMEGDKNTMTVGADGQVMHNLHASEAGTLSVRLLKTSPANGLLMSVYNAQKANPLIWGKNTLVINDPNRGDSITCTGVAFKKKPNLTFAMEGGENEWTFDAASIEYQLTSIAA